MKIVPILVFASACALSGPERIEGIEDIDVSDGKADGDSSVVRLSLGERYELDLDEGSYAAMWLSLESGENAAVVVRGNHGFSPYLVVGSREHIIASRDEQATLAHLPATDALVAFAGPLEAGIVIAGGPSFERGGAATVDVVRLGDAPTKAFDAIGPGQRAIFDAGRELEPDRRAFVSRGALIETEDGLLETDVRHVPLSERAELNRLAVTLSDIRVEQFRFLDPDEPTRAGANIARLIAATAD